VFVVLLLFGAYRSLGGAPLRAADAGVLLRSLHALLRASIDDLATALTSVGSAEVADSDDGRRARRVSASVQQMLDRLPPPGELDDGDAATRALLGAAAEDIGWAWRMLQADGANPGITAAVAALAAHASECCDQALELLGSVPVGEPLHGT
jgi:hypothetical protein